MDCNAFATVQNASFFINTMIIFIFLKLPNLHDEVSVLFLFFHFLLPSSYVLWSSIHFVLFIKQYYRILLEIIYQQVFSSIHSEILLLPTVLYLFICYELPFNMFIFITFIFAWMVWVSSSSSLFKNFLVTVQNDQVMMATTVTFIFNYFFSYLAKSWYFSVFHFLSISH